MLIVMLKRSGIEDEADNKDAADRKTKIANLSAFAGQIRVLVFGFIGPLPPRGAALKEGN
jgi:hypothetical protein